MNSYLQKYIEEEKREECYQKIQEKEIIFEDDDSASFKVINKQRKTIYKIRVDKNCLIKDEIRDRRKCDWLTFLENDNKVILIELKTNSLNHATIPEKFIDTVEIVELKKENCFCILVSFKEFPSQPKNQERKFSKRMDKNSLQFQHFYKEEDRTKTVEEIFNF